MKHEAAASAGVAVGPMQTLPCGLLDTDLVKEMHVTLRDRFGAKRYNVRLISKEQNLSGLHD